MTISALPPEIWRFIFKHATNFDCSPPSQNDEQRRRQCSGPGDVLCPDDPTLHELKAMRLNTVTNLCLVCRQFHGIALESLFEVVFITNQRTAGALARLLAQDIRRGDRIRQIFLIVGSSSISRAEEDFRTSLISIIESLRRLEVFQMKCCSSTPEWRDFEEKLVLSLPNPSTVRHFGWNSMGLSYLQSPSDSFLRFFRRAKSTIETIDLSGFFPFPDAKPGYSIDEKLVDECTYPALKRLKVSRTYFCDLALLGSWNITENLVCLEIGTVWSYFDNREGTASFFQSPHPHLRCVHFGRDSKICPLLAKNILSSAPKLQAIDYFVLGNWSERIWEGEKHENVQDLDISLSHHLNPLRSLFREGGVKWDQRMVFLKSHILSASRAFPSLKRVRLRVTATTVLGGSEFEKWFKDSVGEMFSPDAGVKVTPVTTLEIPHEETNLLLLEGHAALDATPLSR